MVSLNPLRAARRLKHRAAVARADRDMVEDNARRRASGPFAEQYARAQAGMELPDLGRAEGIWAVAMVKDEADVLGAAVRHLRAQGVEHFLVVDNGSTDATPRILRELAEEIPGFRHGADREPAYFQSAKMTCLADAAGGAGATWVLPFDADEFWYGAEGTVAQALAGARAPRAYAFLHNAFPVPGSASLWADATEHAEGKIAFRPGEQAILEMGNHGVSRTGETEDVLRIVHRPWRSREQIARKLRGGAAAIEQAGTGLAADQGGHWRRFGTADDAALDALWEQILSGEAPAEISWRPRRDPARTGRRARIGAGLEGAGHVGRRRACFGGPGSELSWCSRVLWS